MSATSTIALEELRSPHQVHNGTSKGASSESLDIHRRHSNREQTVLEALEPSASASTQLQRWNYPRRNVFRTSAAFWGFIVMGANDAAIGALIPYLEAHYNLTYTVVSLVFLSPVAGYILASVTNNWFHYKFGQRGVAMVCPAFHLITYIVAALHPPFPVIIIAYILSGYGNGLLDAAWNAWISNMDRSNEVLGILHGFYGLGATLAPLAATAMITKGHTPWWYFYYVMIGVAVIELVASTAAFWQANAAQYRKEHPQSSDTTQKAALKEALGGGRTARVTWLAALFLTFYVGIEVALGGWITTFMLRVRQADAFASGMASTGFWLGITVGRVVLGFVTPRIGETLAIWIYLILCMGLELLFWLVPQFYVSSVAVGLLGFFLGPLFPAAIVAISRLLPRHLHITAIGFAAAFGGIGAAIFPFAVGAIAQASSVKSLQPVVLAMLVVALGIWAGLPRIRKKDE